MPIDLVYGSKKYVYLKLSVSSIYRFINIVLLQVKSMKITKEMEAVPRNRPTTCQTSYEKRSEKDTFTTITDPRSLGPQYRRHQPCTYSTSSVQRDELTVRT